MTYLIAFTVLSLIASVLVIGVLMASGRASAAEREAGEEL